MHGKETGLKSIYRVLGVTIAKILARFFKPFNPNTITVTGAVVCIGSIIIFGLYGKKATYDGYMLILVLGTQLGLILDYADGAYARLVDRTTYRGYVLDASLDFVKLIFLLGLSYLVAGDRIERLVVFGVVLVYGFHCSLKSLSIREQKTHPAGRRGDTADSARERWAQVLRIPLGFNLVHIYLYILIWLLSGLVYILMVLFMTGLISAFENLRTCVRNDAGRT